MLLAYICSNISSHIFHIYPRVAASNINPMANLDRLRFVARVGDLNLLYDVLQDDPLILAGIDSEQFVETPLHIAAYEGNIPFAVEVMNLKPSFVLKLNMHGYSPIHIALHEAKDEMVLCFVNINKDLVRVKGRGGMTPLHLASELGQVELLAKFLTACPDSINDVTVWGETALHIAVKHNNYDALELLVCFLRTNYKRGARKLEYTILNQKDEDHKTALDMAIEIEARSCLVANVEMRSTILLSAGAKRGTQVIDAPTFANSTIMDKVIVYVYRFRSDILDEQRNTWLIIATLVATATYQSVLSPPGGFYQANATDNNVNITFSSNSTISTLENAGKSVLSRGDFLVFSHLNVFSFIVSTLAILIMTPWGEVGTLVIGPMVWFAVSYLYSMWVISPTPFNSIIDKIFLSIIGLALVILFIIIVYSVLQRHRNAMLRN
jgi:ankyrin repeat protein